MDVCFASHVWINLGPQTQQRKDSNYSPTIVLWITGRAGSRTAGLAVIATLCSAASVQQGHTHVHHTIVSKCPTFVARCMTSKLLPYSTGQRQTQQQGQIQRPRRQEQQRQRQRQRRRSLEWTQPRCNRNCLEWLEGFGLGASRYYRTSHLDWIASDNFSTNN